MMGKLMGQGLVELLLPIPPRPILLFGQHCKGAVIEIDIPAHLIVAVFPHDVHFTGRKVRVGMGFREKQDPTVQVAEKGWREGLRHGIQQFARLVEGQHHMG